MALTQPSEMAFRAVLTRFNVRLSSNQEAPDDDWLKSRLDLFLRYCLPSIAMQTHQPDIWIVFVDAESPAWLMKRLDSIVTDTKYKIFRTDGVFDSGVAVNALQPYVPSTSNTVITTRFDNDDALHPNFLALVYAASAATGADFINVISGYQISGSDVYLRSDPSNPFITRVERIDHSPLKTVFATRHDTAAAVGAIQQVQSVPMWAQIVHGSNLANALRGIPARHAESLASFPPAARVVPSATRKTQLLKLGQLFFFTMRRPHRIRWVVYVATTWVRNQVSAASAGRILARPDREGDNL